MVYATSLLEVRLLDHVIVGEDRFYSFADRGLIDIYLREFKRNPAMTYFREIPGTAVGWGDKEEKKKSGKKKK